MYSITWNKLTGRKLSALHTGIQIGTKIYPNCKELCGSSFLVPSQWHLGRRMLQDSFQIGRSYSFRGRPAFFPQDGICFSCAVSLYWLLPLRIWLFQFGSAQNHPQPTVEIIRFLVLIIKSWVPRHGPCPTELPIWRIQWTHKTPQALPYLGPC